MPTIALAVSGLKEGIDIVWPLMPHIVGAFQPFGINLVPVPGTLLEQDPEEQADGWRTLVAKLEQQSRMATPAHLVVTKAPPGFVRTINGMLLDTSARGVVAVYLDAYFYGNQGPANRRDLVAQVCIHELGHLLNLTHEDAGVDNPDYASAMLPSAVRQYQDVATAWQIAEDDARRRAEPLMNPPGAADYYPFNAQCRANLRAASTDPLWLPFRGPFRGEFEGASAGQDAMRLHLDAAVELYESEFDPLADDLHLTLTIENEFDSEVLVPAHISPEHGTLRLIAPEGCRRKVRHVGALCSPAHVPLAPRQRIYRSFDFGSAQLCDSRVDEPLIFRIDLVDAGRILGTTNFACARVNKKARDPGLQRRASSPLRVIREANGITRRGALERFVAARHPTAMRHVAARALVRERIRDGGDWRKIANEMRRELSQPLHDEVHDNIREMGEGWTTYQEGRSRH